MVPNTLCNPRRNHPRHTNFRGKIITEPIQEEDNVFRINTLVDQPFNKTHFQKMKSFFTETDLVQASVFGSLGIVTFTLICLLPCIILRLCRPECFSILFSVIRRCFCCSTAGLKGKQNISAQATTHCTTTHFTTNPKLNQTNSSINVESDT